MPVWAWIAIVVGAILLVAAGVTIGILSWRTYCRRTLLKLVVRQEAVEAASSALDDTLKRMAEASDEELEAFASHPDSTDRHALDEVHDRAALLVEELDHLPLPRSLVHVADAISDAAFVIRDEAGRVTADDADLSALDRLADIDLAGVRAYTQKARSIVRVACEEWGLDETAVYGGGLYL